jgi:hypothetical protein
MQEMLYQPYRCGRSVVFYFSDPTGRHSVACAVSDQGQYGRKLATCYIGDRNLNKVMVSKEASVACFIIDDAR